MGNTLCSLEPKSQFQSSDALINCYHLSSYIDAKLFLIVSLLFKKSHLTAELIKLS